MSNISDKDAIALVKAELEERFEGAAEPLWDLDDNGNPIYVDIGCATWVFCELFEIQDDPSPEVERDEEGIAVAIQARMKWSHWDFMTTREYYVPIYFEEGEWQVSSEFGWEDVDIEDVEGEEGETDV